MGVCHREPDPGQPPVLRERQKQGGFLKFKPTSQLLNASRSIFKQVGRSHGYLQELHLGDWKDLIYLG